VYPTPPRRLRLSRDDERCGNTVPCKMIRVTGLTCLCPQKPRREVMCTVHVQRSLLIRAWPTCMRTCALGDRVGTCQILSLGEFDKYRLGRHRRPPEDSGGAEKTRERLSLLPARPPRIAPPPRLCLRGRGHVPSTCTETFIRQRSSAGERLTFDTNMATRCCPSSMT